MKQFLVLCFLLTVWLAACGNIDESTETGDMSETGIVTMDSTVAPTEEPTEVPTEVPTEEPTETPTEEPTKRMVPTVEPIANTRLVDGEASNPALAGALQALIEEQVSEGGFPGVILHVSAPDIGFNWHGAAGMANPDTNTALIADDQFALASVTKMYTAAVVLKLIEQGQLSLDDFISLYLPADLVAKVHVFEGESYGEQLTVRHLLNHTSGFADFTAGYDADENGIPDMKDMVQAEPDKFWTTDEVLSFAISVPPLFPPGAAMAYSDLNYQLLGLIIEEITAMTLAEGYRHFIFEPVGMTHTYLEFREEPVPGIDGRSMAHLYYGELDWTDYESRSYDWGAGGIVATAADQVAFMWALTSGNLFSEPTSVTLMQEWVDTGFPGWSYGLGQFNIDMESLGAPGLGHLYGHGGTWNSFAYYVPEMNIVLVGTLSGSDPLFGHLPLVIQTLYTIQSMSQ